ncbi:MAG: DMT family transporter [Actinomycetes bacterium]|jgi:drug/metabolite transporter (DMT)-like permease|nr:MAG: EamA family transporter [Actinomycetota bacterium]
MSHPAARRALLALIAASFLFGATFVVIKSALEDIPPMEFVAWRFLIGAVAAMVIAFPRGRQIWRDGAITGLALFAGYALQTMGLAITSASNSALITGMYVVLTPFIASLVRRRAPSPWVVLAAAASFAGIYLLSDTDGLSLSRGDLLTLGCAFAFAFHIIALSRYAHRHPILPYTGVQLLTTAVLAFPVAAIQGGVSLPGSSVWPALLLTGLGVGIGAFMLQVWAQTVVGPSTAAIILAAEPAFGVATAWVVLDERLDVAGWIGTALVVFAIFLVVTRQEEDVATAEAVTEAH